MSPNEQGNEELYFENNSGATVISKQPMYYGTRKYFPHVVCAFIEDGFEVPICECFGGAAEKTAERIANILNIHHGLLK